MASEYSTSRSGHGGLDTTPLGQVTASEYSRSRSGHGGLENV